MSNPSHILFDSDALIQVFMARQGVLLAKLRERCGVMPAVVPQVEQEVRWHSKFRSLYETNIYSAVSGGNLIVLDNAKVRGLFLARGVTAPNLDIHMQAVGKKCREYCLHVDEGEAYTHAMATALNLPAISNDNEALKVLREQGKEAACPTLRFFDLLVFARDCDWIDEATCESARSQLSEKKEHLPFAFRSKESFATGRKTFSCRISTTPLALPTSTPDGQLHLTQQ